MRRNFMIILGVLIVVCLIGAIGAYTFYNSTPTYKNITMNSIQMEVPDSNATVVNQTDLFSIYNDTEKGIQVVVFDSEGSNMGDISEMTTYATIREANQVEAVLQQEDNQSYNYSESLKQYTYLYNYTHKNVFIVTKDKEDMKHILKTMKLTNTSDVNKTNNTTNTTQKTTTKKTTTSSSKSSNSDEITYDEELNDYFDSNGRTVYEGQFPKGTSKEEIREGLDAIAKESQ